MAKRKTMLEKLLGKQTSIALAELHDDHLECTLYTGVRTLDSIQREAQSLGLKKAYILIREGTTDMAYMLNNIGVLRGFAGWPDALN